MKTPDPGPVDLVLLSDFSEGSAAPDAATLGEKAWALAELVVAGAPVPEGFVLTTELCRKVLGGADGGNGVLASQVEQGLAWLAERTGRQFGDAKKPLLVSLRSSGPQGTRSALPTLVNLGLTEEGVKGLAKQTGDEKAAWDAFRRLLAGFGEHVLGLDPEGLEQLENDALKAGGVDELHELDAPALEALAKGVLEFCRAGANGNFPQTPKEQLLAAVSAGFAAWDRPAARAHRAAMDQGQGAGTALIVQEMVLGTVGKVCGVGSLFSRHPATGNKETYGKYLPQAYGGDLTAGVRMTEEVATLKKAAPKIFEAAEDWARKAERHFRDAQEVHFTVAGDKLYLLQARPAGRTPHASLKIALALVDEGICSEREALVTVDPAGVERLLHPSLDKSSLGNPLTKGLPASPGCAVGRVVFFAEHAEELAAQGVNTILVRHETTPEDIGGLNVAQGILTGTGGLTSHAAVVARGMGKCCIVGASAIDINYHVNEMTVGATTVKKLDWVSLDGNTGEIYPGQAPTIPPSVEGDLARILGWADEARTMGVRANADTEEDARKALELGAEGIGLCRTEHMFFHIDRIPIFRKMILAVDEVGRSAALGELLPHQRKDFLELFRVMAGRPLTIRLLDPPLNEFLPRGIRSQTRTARAMRIPLETLQRRIEVLSESNPMLGHRGCRLALTYPEIYQMQVRAIVEAACIVAKEGVAVHPEIMVPLVSTARELEILRGEIVRLAEQVMLELGEQVPFHVGTMVETPRAAMCSASIAPYADFYSFGTNDLTQMGYGFSRDDSGSFLPHYLEKGVLDVDPFIALDQEGIGAMVRIAIEQGRSTKPTLQVGICGEHGGEPESVKFCHRLGLDYVSCSPFRIPVARLAAGQAAAREAPAGGAGKRIDQPVPETAEAPAAAPA